LQLYCISRTRLPERTRDSTRTADLQTSDKVTLGTGFGQDHGLIGGYLTPVTLSIGYKFILN
jgi:hypothetical protein